MITEAAQAPFSAKFVNSPPKKQAKNNQSTRKYLSDHEINDMRKAAKQVGRHHHRDDTLILMMFRHGLRVSEAVSLRWDQVDLKQGHLHVSRIKNGKDATHPIRGIELRALRKLQRDYLVTPYLFITERKAPLSARSAYHIVQRAGKLANLPIPVHPHMLRHSTGFYLANKGCDTRAIQDYLGHTNIKNTVIYTELSPQRFKDFWKD